MDPSAKTMQAGAPFRPANAGVSPKSAVDQHRQIKAYLFEDFDLLTMIFVVQDDLRIAQDAIHTNAAGNIKTRGRTTAAKSGVSE